MRNYNNPEMKIASFDNEEILTASSFLQTVQEWVDGGDGRQSTTVDYEQMPSVSFGF